MNDLGSKDVGTGIHVGYDLSSTIQVTNRDELPCRAAVVTAATRDGLTPVTIFPPYGVPHAAAVREWHRPEDCKR
jgi:hypothetical protein